MMLLPRYWAALPICVAAVTLLLVMNPSPTLGRSKTITLDVAAFGAVPSDGKDDSSAVRAALQKCKKLGRATLVFPRGTYDFFASSSTRDKSPLFLIADLDGLTIDGRGSEFIVHTVASVFEFEKCRHVTLKNFTVDWARAPFSVGRVLAVADNHFDVEIFPEYPVKGGEPVGAFMDYDPVTRLPICHGLDEYYSVDKTELLHEQVLRVHLKHQALIRPDVLVLLRHQVYGFNTLHFDRCSDVTVEDVTLHSVPGMGLVASVCNGVNLKRFRVMPRPGSGHLMSSTADATHFGGCKGTIRMDGCEYRAMGDDAVNIRSGIYLSLKQKVNDHTILAAHNLKGIDPPDPGDTMEVSHMEDLLPYAKVRVRKSEVLPTDGLHRIEFEKPLSDGLKEGDVFGNATRVARVRIRNCRVSDNRARGMLIQTRNAIVESCTFRNCTGPGILVLTEVAYFFESIGTRNVTIRNNTFENTNYAAAIGPGALCAIALLKDFKYPPKSGVHKCVLFEGNTIRQTDNSGIFIAGVDGIIIRNNRVEKACSNPTVDTGGSAIYVMSSQGIRIEGNSVEPGEQGGSLRKVLEFGDGAERDAALVTGNKGF